MHLACVRFLFPTLAMLTALFTAGFPAIAQAELPEPLATGLALPESVVMGADGRFYVSQIGVFDQDGDGSIAVIVDGKPEPFATGLNDPKGLAAAGGGFFVADKDRILAIDPSGKATLFVPPNAFPKPPLFLNDLVLDAESGMLYVSDTGDRQGNGGVVYRITPKGLVDIVISHDTFPELQMPNGLLLDGASHLLVGDFGTGMLYRVKLADRTAEKIAEGLGGIDGLIWDRFGRLYSTDWPQGRVFAMGRPGSAPQMLASGLKSAADLCLDPTTGSLIVPDMLGGTLTAIKANLPGAEVLDTPLAVKPAVAFGELKWTGWKAESEQGVQIPLRPIVLTHANDGSNRIFVATQQGVIHSFVNKEGPQETSVLLDIEDKVRYVDSQNEEGLLGLAFHPDYKTNGELFVFYTPRREEGGKLESIVSRFRVKKNVRKETADPASEEILLRVERPFWNHDGGTIAFGPDGYLYITMGDGGAANDLHGNGQNQDTLLGKILRIDVNKAGLDRPYSIPDDNPYNPSIVPRPEIWAHGFRNVWRFSFDRQTGDLWAADVGQNLWEEINLVTKGGNYGWNLREGLHPFGSRGVGPQPELTDPIWEYHHDTGKSITGGVVYRGKKVPSLQGAYLYADYVTGLIWALRYDKDAGRVVANQPILGDNLPILSFGEDKDGEVYFLVVSATGQGIYRFEDAK